jgi:hypothetical protein
MPDEQYVVIACSEDGNVSIKAWSKEDLLDEVLNQDDPHYGTTECFTSMPDSDPQSWPRKLLILRGGIVVPKAVEKVTQYEID